MADKSKRKAEEAGKRKAKPKTKATPKAAKGAAGKLSEAGIKGKTAAGTGDPKEIAIRCYGLLQKGDRDAWVKTLSLYLQEKAGVGGSSAHFWWKTGRHYIEDYGVSYEFLKEDKPLYPNTRKFFFKRKNADGSDRGSPVPCTVRIDEDGVWRVDQQSV